MPKVLVLKVRGTSCRETIFGHFWGKSWPEKITSLDGCFVLIIQPRLESWQFMLCNMHKLHFDKMQDAMRPHNCQVILEMFIGFQHLVSE